ncbi:MAG TPA: hypothetical protein VMS93_11780 [Candidatus Saccharimonadales bacterium]|nr:hypothetical protein [Candidatus Saccharimonadales bacterium]
MKSMGKVVVPVGGLLVLGGLFGMGYDALWATGILLLGGLVVAAGLVDVFRWDRRA